MTTIYEVAQATGFSPSTVSRALNDSGYCSPSTREAIKKAASELNYVPSSAARTLKTKLSKRILFCIPDILNPFYFEMIRGTTDVLDQYGYYSMLCYTQHKLSEELKFLKLLAEQYGDGMIMVSFHFDQTNIEQINRSPYPIVTTNLYPEMQSRMNFDTVYVDHTRAMYLATEHLVKLGHRDIAVLVGNLGEQTSKERASGFTRCLEDNRIPFDESNFLLGDYSKESGQRAAVTLLESERRFTGIISANDLMSVGLISVLGEHGIHFPEQYSLVSLDNTDYAEAIQPSITSIDMQQYAIGTHAAELLIERIQGGRETSVIKRLEPFLVERHSCRTLD